MKQELNTMNDMNETMPSIKWTKDQVLDHNN